MKNKKILVEVSPKMYNELTEVAGFIGITIPEYLKFLLLRTQPVPVQVPAEVYNRIITGPTPIFKQASTYELSQEEMDRLDGKAIRLKKECEQILSKDNYIG